LQQHAGEAVIEPDVLLAHAIEHAFDHVGEFDDGRQREDASTALDGMGGAEQRVDALVGILVQRGVEQAAFHALQQLAGFLQKGGENLLHAHFPAPCAGLRAEVRSIGSPEQPARLQSSKVWSAASLCATTRSARWLLANQDFRAVSSCTPAEWMRVPPDRSRASASPSPRCSGSTRVM